MDATDEQIAALSKKVACIDKELAVVKGENKSFYRRLDNIDLHVEAMDKMIIQNQKLIMDRLHENALERAEFFGNITGTMRTLKIICGIGIVVVPTVVALIVGAVKAGIPIL